MYLKDSFKIKDTSKSTSNGFIVFSDVKIANAGNIQAYLPWELLDLPEHLQDKEEILIYRPKKEIKKSLQSFSHLPLTDEHPDEEVSTSNYRDYAVGISSNAEFKDSHVVSSSIIVTDAVMIEELQSRAGTELSCGYTAEIIFKAGTTKEGKPYDAYMKNIRANHIAIVERGRCGGSCKL